MGLDFTRRERAALAVLIFLSGMFIGVLVGAATEQASQPSVNATEFPDHNVLCFTSGAGDTVSIECLTLPSENASSEVVVNG